MTSLADDSLKVLAAALMPIMQEMIDEAYQEDQRRAAGDSPMDIFKDPLANTEIFYRIGKGDFGVCPLGVVLATWNLFPLLEHVSATLADGRPFVYMLENGKILNIERRS